MRSKSTKSTLLYGLVAIFAVWLCCWGVSAALQPNRTAYPGSGVYDLTDYLTCEVSGSIGSEAARTVGFDFKTNSKEINVRNDGEQEVTVYLYASDAGDDFLLDCPLRPGKKARFTHLTAAREYQVGVEGAGSSYTLSITD